ncbi:hypothetical protein ACYZTL_00210 [Pseudomonas sp. LB3P81]
MGTLQSIVLMAWGRADTDRRSVSGQAQYRQLLQAQTEDSAAIDDLLVGVIVRTARNS